MARLSKSVVSLSVWTGLITLSIFVGCSPESTNQSTGVPTFSRNGSGGQAEPVTDGTGASQATGSSTVPVTGDGQAGRTATATVVNIGDVCGGQNIQITRKTPIVMFVVDRSGSTSTAYGNGDPDAGMVTTRWQALHRCNYGSHSRRNRKDAIRNLHRYHVI